MNEDCEKHTVDESFKHSLILTINGHKYEWNRQYIKGFEIRKLGNIKSEDDIFLSIVHPWQDELIQDDEEVDLARPEIEHFFSKEKHKKKTRKIKNQNKTKSNRKRKENKTKIFTEMKKSEK